MEKPDWRGVFPVVTTQFRAGLSLDVDATARAIEG
jgi:dihydrodipicolinate synthase/N-acetylneuraminate lyase